MKNTPNFAILMKPNLFGLGADSLVKWTPTMMQESQRKEFETFYQTEPSNLLEMISIRSVYSKLPILINQWIFLDWNEPLKIIKK